MKRTDAAMSIELNATHDPARRSWLESANADGADFPIQNLPFGVFDDGKGARGGVALGSRVSLARGFTGRLVDDGANGRVPVERGGQGALGVTVPAGGGGDRRRLAGWMPDGAGIDGSHLSPFGARVIGGSKAGEADWWPTSRWRANWRSCSGG